MGHYMTSASFERCETRPGMLMGLDRELIAEHQLDDRLL
jgi:hypothetical protein